MASIYSDETSTGASGPAGAEAQYTEAAVILAYSTNVKLACYTALAVVQAYSRAVVVLNEAVGKKCHLAEQFHA